MMRCARRVACALAVFCAPACVASHAGTGAGDQRDSETPDGNGVSELPAADAADAEDRADAAAHDGVHDAGSPGNDAGSANAGDDGATSPDAAEPDAGTRSFEAGLQVWVGEVRSSQDMTCADEVPAPENRRTRILLLFELDATGHIQAASVTMGDGPAPPPAHDPDDFYPPDAPWWPGCPHTTPIPGFEYPGHQPRLEGSRFELTFYPGDAYGPWCALQESYPASNAASQYFGADYLCRPSDETDTNVSFGLDLEVEQLCLGDASRVCDCNADGCWARTRYAHRLDLLVEGDQMRGLLALSRNAVEPGAAEVRLRREE